MNTLAVILTAYRTSQWIEQCLLGFYDQQPYPNWKYELYLGVDSCQETSDVLDRGGWPYFICERNVGTYILSNSLISECSHADVIFRFDTDDVPFPHLLKTMIENTRGGSPAFGTLQDCDVMLTPNGKIKTSSGVTAWPRKWLDRLGGYREDRVACDNDLMARAKLAGCDVPAMKQVAMNSGVNYLRRRSAQSLTRQPACGMRSAMRAEILARHASERAQGGYHVVPVTTRLLYRPGPRPFFR